MDAGVHSAGMYLEDVYRLYTMLIDEQSLERILYVWAIRHPASGYVQGINDLATPFFQVFLSAYIGISFHISVYAQQSLPRHADSDPEEFDIALLSDSVRTAVEADTFWCLSRLLDGIQDNYIAGQPGIQRSVKRMAELVARIDGASPVSMHICASVHRLTVLSSYACSAFGSASRRGERGVHAVRVPVDELFVDA